MGTKDFNFIDKAIAYLRLRKVRSYVEKGDVVLDFGCGSQAFFLHSVEDKIKSGIGVDWEVEDKKVTGNITLIKCRFEDKLPFKDSFFNKIFMLAVLEHISPEKVITLFHEFKRILKPNGKIVLTTPTPASKQILEFLAFKLHLISQAQIADHKMYYGQNDLAILAKEATLILKKHELFQLGMNSLAILEKSGTLPPLFHRNHTNLVK